MQEMLEIKQQKTEPDEMTNALNTLQMELTSLAKAKAKQLQKQDAQDQGPASA